MKMLLAEVLERQVIPKAVSPVWNATMECLWQADATQDLVFTIWDQKRIVGNAQVGRVELPFSDLMSIFATRGSTGPRTCNLISADASARRPSVVSADTPTLTFEVAFLPKQLCKDADVSSFSKLFFWLTFF